MVLLRLPATLYSVANGRAVGTFVLPGELAGYLHFLIPICVCARAHGDERARCARSRGSRALADDRGDAALVLAHGLGRPRGAESDF